MRRTYQVKKLADSLWVVDLETYARGLHLRLRMTIIALSSGGLWLHSPVAIDDALAAQIAALGEVRYIVAPNLNHHLFVRPAKERYPNAEVWGVQGFLAERPQVPIEREFADGRHFGGDIDAIQVQGVPFSNEVLFYHPSSGTLICTDLIHNIQDEEHFLTRQLWRMIGAFRVIGQNRYWRFKTQDRAASKRSIERAIAWGAERLIMSHGDVLERGASEHLRRSIAWLG